MKKLLGIILILITVIGIKEAKAEKQNCDQIVLVIRGGHLYACQFCWTPGLPGSGYETCNDLGPL